VSDAFLQAAHSAATLNPLAMQRAALPLTQAAKIAENFSCCSGREADNKQVSWLSPFMIFMVKALILPSAFLPT